MTPERAMVIISQACAQFRGTLRDHTQIQEALQVVEQRLQLMEQVKEGPDGTTQANDRGRNGDPDN